MSRRDNRSPTESTSRTESTGSRTRTSRSLSRSRGRSRVRTESSGTRTSRSSWSGSRSDDESQSDSRGDSSMTAFFNQTCDTTRDALQRRRDRYGGQVVELKRSEHITRVKDAIESLVDEILDTWEEKVEAACPKFNNTNIYEFVRGEQYVTLLRFPVLSHQNQVQGVSDGFVGVRSERRVRFFREERNVFGSGVAREGDRSSAFPSDVKVCRRKGWQERDQRFLGARSLHGLVPHVQRQKIKNEKFYKQKSGVWNGVDV